MRSPQAVREHDCAHQLFRCVVAGSPGYCLFCSPVVASISCRVVSGLVRESVGVGDDVDPADQQLEVYDTKTGLWHPELGDLTAPDGWEFLPSGDAFLSRRAKAAGRYWTLYQPKGRRAHRRLLGLLAPADAISAARTAAEATAATRETKRAAGARQRAKVEVGYRHEFEQAILLWLDFAPEHAEIARDIATNAVERAAVVGSGRVGRTRTLSLEDRAALAARAYIRHRYTDYEDHLEGLDFAGFEDSLSGLDYRDIKRAAHRAVDDFLEQHRPHG